ncbi:hypothetical protein BE15_15835 [Sorangium cellulosum]|uniref:Polyketide cyclase / dehydrase and lipid transport n=1 Tax=Sorangium cellulosum TaxID=56 RepID=A0A150QZY0_SORCE|nr:SRPBCC family protein [Sorangium cellulosum]KYF73534.1 hypothetical protein BE15_15835 [Sorangium cellulosum]
MSTHDTAPLQPSHHMLPVAGTIEVDIPVDVLWGFFTRPRDWPRWSPCFLWVHNERLAPGQRLTWCFRPIHPFHPYVMPAVADIVEVEPGRRVTWEVTALPGFHARHPPELLPSSHPSLREAASPVAAALSFYSSHVRQSVVELGPGVHVVLGGGGNSLVVEGRGESLLVDTKFFPGSHMLRRWTRNHVSAPVEDGGQHPLPLRPHAGERSLSSRRDRRVPHRPRLDARRGRQFLVITSSWGPCDERPHSSSMMATSTTVHAHTPERVWRDRRAEETLQ